MKKTPHQYCGEWFIWCWTVLDPQSLVSYKSFTAMLVWSFFLSILPKYLFVIIVIYAYFIFISQGSVETNLQCDGMYNNQDIANCLQSVPVKEFSKIIGKDMDRRKVPSFYWPTVYIRETLV